MVSTREEKKPQAGNLKGVDNTVGNVTSYPAVAHKVVQSSYWLYVYERVMLLALSRWREFLQVEWFEECSELFLLHSICMWNVIFSSTCFEFP